MVAVGREQLRELQAPIKQRYQDDPASAHVTLVADGELSEGITCSVATGRALAVAGLHPATGGDGTELCSGDMLLQVDRDAPVGFSAIRMSFSLDTDADAGQLEKLLELTERYCVVYQTLARAPQQYTTITTR